MNLLGLSVITAIGLLMVIVGTTGVIYYIVRYRRITNRRFQRDESKDRDTPPNTYASLWLYNGFLHIGMLLLILGGVGLIYYGQG